MLRCLPGRTLAAGLFSMVLAVPLCGAGTDSLAAGERLLKEGNARGALRELRRAGGSPEALVGTAWAYNELGNQGRAAEAARQAIAANPAPAVLARAHGELGLALLGSGGAGRVREAEAELRQSLAVSGAAPRSLIGLASISLSENHPEAALSLARQYLAGDPVSEDSKDARRLVCKAKTQIPEDQAGKADFSLAAGVQVPRNAEPEGIDLPIPSREAVRKARSSAVDLQITIDEEGCTRDILVEGTVHPSVGKAVATTAQSWVFQPAWEDGKPVSRSYPARVWILPFDTTAPASGPLDPFSPHSLTVE